MSKLFVDLTIAFRNLVQHRRRTIFLGAAIAAVTALLVLLNGLSTGVRETMIDTATTLSSGHVNVGGFFKVTAGQSAPVVTDYTKVLEVVKRTVPEMAFSVHRGRGWAKVVSDIGRERGWPPMTRRDFEAQIGPEGALMIGDPDEVAEKILRHSDALGGISRVTFQMNAASLAQEKMTQAIELIGTRVAPAMQARRGAIQR